VPSLSSDTLNSPLDRATYLRKEVVKDEEGDKHAEKGPISNY